MQQICAGHRYMQYGDNYASLKLVQTALMELGYGIPDGASSYFGLQTVDALKKYQAQHYYVLKGENSGILDAKTLNELDYDVNLHEDSFKNQNAPVAGGHDPDNPRFK